MKTQSKEKVIATIIKAQGSKAVTVTFKKKTDGKMRVLNGRLGVKKGVTGKGLRFDPKAYDLLSIYDMQKHAFRFINLPSVKKVVADGVTYKF